MDGPLVAGVDVGGTNIEVGLVGADHTVRDRAKANTPTGGPGAVLEVIAGLVDDLDEAPIAVGVGIPGVVHEGRVLTVPNLAGWHDPIDLGAELAERTGLPVRWATTRTSGCSGSGWPARRGAPRTCWVCGWEPGSAAG
jgi:glucokinase